MTLMASKYVKSRLLTTILLTLGLLAQACGNDKMASAPSRPRPANEGFKPLPATGDSAASNQQTSQNTGPSTINVPGGQTSNQTGTVQPILLPGGSQQSTVTPFPTVGAQTINTSLAVYDQGNSNWCWAYSAFHTLRGYYLSSQSTDAATTAWRNALSQLNSADAFRAFMNKISSPDQAGDPIQFVQAMQSSFSLPAQNWNDNYTGSSSASQLVGRIESNLQKGIPSSWCDYGHCVSVQAVQGSGSNAQFTIFDSSGGDSYPRSAADLISQTDMVMVLN